MKHNSSQMGKLNMLLVLEWDSVRDFRHGVSSSRGGELKNPSEWNIEKLCSHMKKNLIK